MERSRPLKHQCAGKHRHMESKTGHGRATPRGEDVQKLLVKWELEQTGKCPQIPVTSAGAVHSHCGLGSCLFKELSSVLGRGEPFEGEIGRENSTSISSDSHQSSLLACLLSVETGILADKNHQNFTFESAELQPRTAQGKNFTE